MSAARWTRLFGVVGMLLALYFVVPANADPHGGPVLRGVLTVLVLVALAATVIGQVRLSAADPARHIDGLVLVIVAVWLVFAFAFYLLARRPDQVTGLDTRIDGLYFAASTMLTIGFGDVHATGQVARALVLVQLLFDAVFVAIAATMLTTRLRSRVAAPVVDQEHGSPRNPG